MTRAGVALLTLTGIAAQQRSGPVTIRAVELTPRGAEIVVTIAADGLLPPLPIGVLDDPPRIYLDFAGIRSVAPVVTRGRDPRIRRVRVSPHSATPLVTRVVIDLTSAQPHRIELEPTRIRIVIGAAPPEMPLVPGLQPVPPLPAPASPVSKEAGSSAGKEVGTNSPGDVLREPRPAGIGRAGSNTGPVLPGPPPAPSPALSPRQVPGPSLETPPPKELEKYRRQVSTALDRLRLQQPILISLDANEPQTVERLQMAVEEFERLRQELTTTKPPDTLKAHHDMLIQSSTMAVMAARLRIQAMQTSDPLAVPAIVRNAASAAAGAILLLDRACADLACPDPPGR